MPDTIKSAVYRLLDDSPPCDLSGWRLFDAIHEATGLRPYPPTLLQYARDYADISGGVFRCVDAARPRYRYEPGTVRLSGAIIEGRE